MSDVECKDPEISDVFERVEDIDELLERLEEMDLEADDQLKQEEEKLRLAKEHAEEILKQREQLDLIRNLLDVLENMGHGKEKVEAFKEIDRILNINQEPEEQKDKAAKDLSEDDVAFASSLMQCMMSHETFDADDREKLIPMAMHVLKEGLDHNSAVNQVIHPTIFLERLPQLWDEIEKDPSLIANQTLIACVIDHASMVLEVLRRPLIVERLSTLEITALVMKSPHAATIAGVASSLPYVREKLRDEHWYMICEQSQEACWQVLMSSGLKTLLSEEVVQLLYATYPDLDTFLPAGSEADDVTMSTDVGDDSSC